MILVALLFAAFLINLDTTLVNVALPALTRELHATTTQLQWVVDSFNLVFAALLLTFWETWPSALAAAVLFGIGFGCYIAVDQALITQVLPKAHDRAKDLGIINIAIVTPYAIGPAIAAPLVSLAGYPALFGATAAVALAAAVGVWKIKSVS